MLVYSAITSLDGYVNDESGSFDWAEPDEEVHAAANDLLRPVRTHLYGRRLYDVMVAWEGPEDIVAGQPPVMHEFAALWQAADKVVYSTTLEAVSSARTRIERSFDIDAVRDLVARADGDVLIGGATLAAQAIRAGLVDAYHLFVVPVTVGGGTPALPGGVQLELTGHRRFASGVVHLQYRNAG